MRVLIVSLLSVPILGGGVNSKNKEGAELYREGKLDEALAAFTQAQVESPDAPEIHYNIGNVHYRKEEMDKAIEEYRAAQSGGVLVQQHAHYNEGNVHYRAQDFERAVESYKRALKIDPGDIEARQNLELSLERRPGETGEGKGDEEKKSNPQSQKQKQEQPEEQQRDQEQMDQSQQDPNAMSKGEAERILAALAEMEKAEQKRQQEKQKVRVKGKKKDW